MSNQKNEPQQQGISYQREGLGWKREKGGQVGQQAGIFMVMLDVGETQGRDRDTER